MTAYDQYAVQAFRVPAFDYVLKPVAADFFDEVRERLRRMASAYMKRFLVEAVDWLESARK